jgi:hypothetical protein
MPCTFSHPLAVLPLGRFFPKPLHFAALVLGSLSPDFGYYIADFRMSRIAHTLPGTFTHCLPTGLVALVAFYVLRRPLCHILPQPHRAALLPLTLSSLHFSISAIFTIPLCILIGAWTHTIWDSFTHANGWAVQRMSVLRMTVPFANTSLQVSYIVQQASTIGAGVLLLVLYLRWLRHQPAVNKGADAFPDAWRYALLASLALVAVALAVPRALRVSSLFEGYFAFRVFVFRLGVYSATIFAPLLIISSLVLYGVRPRNAPQESLH